MGNDPTTRRGFLQTAAAAGGCLLAARAMGSGPADTSEDLVVEIRRRIGGAPDHTAPANSAPPVAEVLRRFMGRLAMGAGQ